MSVISELFASTLYTGQEGPSTVKATNLLTLKDLEEKLPASALEIADAVKKERLVEINGYLRRISPQSAAEACRSLLDTIIEHALPLSNISLEKCKQLMGTGVDEIILRFVLNSLGKPVTCDIWELASDEVAKASAHSLFQLAQKTNPNKVKW